jgi:hypothetical protein
LIPNGQRSGQIRWGRLYTHTQTIEDVLPEQVIPGEVVRPRSVQRVRQPRRYLGYHKGKKVYVPVGSRLLQMGAIIPIRATSFKTVKHVVPEIRMPDITIPEQPISSKVTSAFKIPESWLESGWKPPSEWKFEKFIYQTVTKPTEFPGVGPGRFRLK